MLQTGESSVTDIAFRCGFNDLSYFIRIFRKYKGISPGKYEKLRSTNEPE
jgi:AraC-like DNA-binding protein